jgi:hypothetical protein
VLGFVAEPELVHQLRVEKFVCEIVVWGDGGQCGCSDGQGRRG